MSVQGLGAYAPHVVGFAKCRACRDEWVCVVPLTDPFPALECPSCGARRGEIYTSFEEARDAMPLERRLRLLPKPLAKT